jgi:transcriptional regulator with XRE-family HTH domain
MSTDWADIPVTVIKSKAIGQLGAAIRELRRIKKVKQATVAAKARLSIQNISTTENGKKRFSLDVLDHVAFALGVPVSWIFLMATQVSEPGEISDMLHVLKGRISERVRREAASQDDGAVIARPNRATL